VPEPWTLEQWISFYQIPQIGVLCISDILPDIRAGTHLKEKRENKMVGADNS